MLGLGSHTVPECSARKAQGLPIRSLFDQGKIKTLMSKLGT